MPVKEKDSYKIFVGDPRPADAMTGYLDPKGGNSILKGPTSPLPPIGGKCVFANRSVAWGRRLIKGKPVTDRKVQPTEDAYTGEVEWLPWGTAGGVQIFIRYKKGCSSLDYDYQITQLRMPRFDEDEEDSYLDFQFGENKIYYDTESVKAEFLKITHSNEDSIFKSPESTGAIFHEVKLFDSTKTDVKEIDELFEAIKLIREANTYAKLNVLKLLVGKKKEVRSKDDDENSLYEALVLLAKQDTSDFMSHISAYKRRVSDLIERCKSYNGIDLTKDGVIVAGQSKREVLLSEIPAKGELMIDWMFQNCLLPEVYEAVDKLVHISEKFK